MNPMTSMSWIADERNRTLSEAFSISSRAGPSRPIRVGQEPGNGRHLTRRAAAQKGPDPYSRGPGFSGARHTRVLSDETAGAAGELLLALDRHGAGRSHVRRDPRCGNAGA